MDPALLIQLIDLVAFFFLRFIYLFERERECTGVCPCMNRVGAEGEGKGRESQADSPLSAEPTWGLIS